MLDADQGAREGKLLARALTEAATRYASLSHILGHQQDREAHGAVQERGARTFEDDQ